MDTKLCIDCNSTKLLTEFYKSKSHSLGVMCYCKQCFNARCVKRWIQRKIDYINLVGGKCEKCNLTLKDSHYSIFEFHHKFDQTKDFEWSKLRLKSHNKIMKELNKCSLLCANCHRLEHAEFRNL